MKGLSLILIVLGLLMLAIPFSHDGLGLIAGKDDNASVELGLYQEHEPIEISDNGEFEDQEWPGNGTPGNPYLIEGLEIRSDSTCIWISQTTVHFEITNCIISGNNEGNLPGIHLSNLVNGTVRNCIVQDHVIGFYASHCEDCNLFNNTAKGNRIVGFHVYWTRNCLMKNNTAFGESRYNFQLANSESCAFVNNIGINSSKYGLYLYTSQNCSIFNNTFTGCGLRVYGWDMSYWMHSVSGNIVNEKPLLYYKNANGSTIDASQYGQVVLTNCTTVTVVNGTFTQGSGGVWLMYCFDCSVIGNIANSSYTGFTFQRSDYCVLANNTVWNTSAHGFKIWYSGNCTVSNNTVTGSSIGYSIYGSGRNTIEINTARQNGIGFDVGHSYENVFLENSIDQNNEGFSLQLSVACILQNNTFIDDALSIQGYVQNHWEHSILGNTVDGSPLGYFLWENDSIIQASQYGQIILVSGNGTRISDGTFQNKPRGIVLAYSDNCRLVNITVAESQSNGYSLYSCVNCTLENSTAFQNVGHGVYSEYSPSCGFANNNASSNSGHGFVLFHSGKSSIVNSRIGGNSEQGIELLHSSNCIVENNTLKDNSLMITGINGSWMHNISGNTIDGAQLGYFRGITNRAFDADEFGQLILVDCHGVIVEDGVLNKTSGGIQLVYCTQVTITRVTVIGSSTHAFFLWDTLSVTLSDNVAADCRGDGFVLVSGTGCSFLNNIANGNERNGYYLGLATGCVLADNTALDNGDSGFVMKGCESCTFEGNTAGRNSNDGFDVYASETLITRNEAHGNGRDGFHLSISESDVMKNVVTENRRYGVYLDSESYGNLLFLNRLGFNGIADAMNNGHATLWHNGGFGNYWGTYDGNGTYSVPGAEESIDFHPYEYYRASPVIDHPDDISYSYEPNGNGTAHAIIWRAWDWGHTAYRIWRDSSLVSAATLHGSHIIIHEIYRELTPGVYNYTVVVTDEEENSISDTVSVTIEWPEGYEPGIFDSTDVHLLLIVVGAVSAVVVIAVLAVEGFEKRS